MSNWFGNLQLAYKYVIVFLSLLALTILAGFIKVMYNRQKLKKAKQTELEAGPKEDTVELNQREKDEGDLFGIRAIEAGFYAGVAQSRPTSRAGSVMGDNPTMSTSTLVGGSVNSPLMKGQSANNSMLSLNLNANKEPNAKRVSPPTMKLRPSEAELSGRRNHNGAVDMSLQVPPSPGHPRGPPSPTFGGSDSDSEGFTSPRSMSPADLNRQQYAPALTVSHHTGDDGIRSQQGSYHNSPGQSPTPLSPHNPPTAKLPSIPGHALRKESRSPSPEYDYPRVQVHEPNSEPSSPARTQVQLQARTYSPHHERDGSEASSIYSSGNRLSTFQAYQASQEDAPKPDSYDQAWQKQQTRRSASAASTVESGHTSILASTDDEAERRPSHASTLLAPGQGGKDTRLSEFYEAYYRNSHMGSTQPVDVKKQYAERQSTIMEVDTPMASPMFPHNQNPGAAF
ncbi:hypothetical protein AA0119_g3821 [Alternaria tenuissima]|uniref:Uncharacterized protein n=2 Tax=Alternaria sect. Alternaria TaxID=2499237 RepID=A0AB37WBT4_9PLEO|nr:hypothetical protein AG0111_0g4312 [Alternaria gaisen]KAH6852119.1 hypothetical protein B0T12DRAFT_484604 [Alternaria alternata]RYN24367.1 hypothetical protein AA0115_g8207 [Alternaria tenuissima]OWY41564.1 hypothetical protein AALT_g1317 [Alternaria alternata]RYN88525.1 hypothetical protein AA0120_g6830 [Alternaria tenuissima]